MSNQLIEDLRKIGWDHWDPIEIRRGESDAWKDRAADQYDTYLMTAAKMLTNGKAVDDVADYLDDIVAVTMYDTDTVSDEMHVKSLKTAEEIAWLLINRTNG